MKNSLVHAVAASSLFLSATSANAQDSTVEADFDKITACFDRIERPSMVFAQEKPVPGAYISANGKKETADCGLSLLASSVADKTTYSLKMFTTVANPQTTKYEVSITKGSDVSYYVQSDGVVYQATPIEGEKDKARIEIVAPTAALLEENDIDLLNAEVSKGNIIMKLEGDMTRITVPSGDVYDWIPQEIQENLLMVQLSAGLAIQRFDVDLLEAAAEKSRATSSTVFIPGQP